MQSSIYVVVAIFGSRCVENFVLFSTAAHGSALQRVWSSTQRSRGVEVSFAAPCVLLVHYLYFLTWLLHWHCGFHRLAGSHFSCLTDISWTRPQTPLIQLCTWPFRVYITRCTCCAVSSSASTEFCFYYFQVSFCAI